MAWKVMEQGACLFSHGDGAAMKLSSISPPTHQHRGMPSRQGSPRNSSEQEDGNLQPAPNFAFMAGPKHSAKHL